MLEANLKKDLKSEKSFWCFLGMNIITYGLYALVWDMRFIEKTHEKYGISERLAKQGSTRLWAYVILFYFCTYMFSSVAAEIMFTGDFDLADALNTTSGFFSLIAFCVGIALSLQLREILIRLFEIQGITRKVNLLWSIILGSIYFYYIIYKLKPTDNLVLLEKLSDLKEKGTISEEEFEVEKKKILG